jgi:SAM-dependent methyltransferase
MHNPDSADLWGGRYKIPWDEPGFSGRMLAEHLNQNHDMASRRTAMIDSQVAWLHQRICASRPCRILDLACGPGLYSNRLAGLGHSCVGIDFGPASIAYAQLHAVPGCEFVLGDLRQTGFRSGHEVAMMIFGEFNVFPPEEIRAILAKVRDALVPGGVLVVEMQTFASVRDSGLDSSFEYKADSGVFSAYPHRVRVDNAWYEEEATARTVFRVTDVATGKETTYHSTTKAWSEDACRKLFAEASFSRLEFATDWPVPGDGLQLVVAQRDGAALQ